MVKVSSLLWIFPPCDGFGGLQGYRLASNVFSICKILCREFLLCDTLWAGETTPSFSTGLQKTLQCVRGRGKVSVEAGEEDAVLLRTHCRVQVAFPNITALQLKNTH